MTGVAMRIDAHQHFWHYSPEQYAWIDASMGALQRDFLPADLQPEMRRARIDASIAVQVRQSLEETEWLLRLADLHPSIAGVVGWVDLQADDVRAQLARLARHPRLVGIRHIVQAEPDDRFLLRPAFCRGVSALAEFDLAYDILIYPRHLAAAAEFVARFPAQRFVLDHMAKPAIRSGDVDGWAAGIRRLAEHPNLYCKVSGLVTEADWEAWTPVQIRPYLDVAFDAFGADRLIAGSDWPVCTVAADYTRTLALVEDYVNERPAADRDAVLGGNARRFWRLPPVASPLQEHVV